MAWEQINGSLDFGFLPSNYQCDVQVFNPFGNPAAGGLTQKWTKPRGISMVYMMVISSGGGGGGGFSAASTNPRGGGGSGACGGMGTIIKPALFLPDILSVFVAAGGVGGAAGIAGGSGGVSYISTGVGLTGVNTIPNLVITSGGGNVPGGGGAGTAGGGGAAGTVPTISSATLSGHSAAFGNGFWLVGLAGAAGGAQTGAAGGGIIAGWNLIPFTPGASGAGVNTVNTGFAGGPITLQAAMDYADGNYPAAAIAGGVAGGAGAAGNGNAGYQSYKPFVGTGGTGGGSSDGSTGGVGGNGAIGCGGGGGGGGVTGGRGGNGGDGLVVIISW